MFKVGCALYYSMAKLGLTVRSAQCSHILTELLEYDVACTFFPFKYLDVSSPKNLLNVLYCKSNFLQGTFQVRVT